MPSEVCVPNMQTYEPVWWNMYQTVKKENTTFQTEYISATSFHYVVKIILK